MRTVAFVDDHAYMAQSDIGCRQTEGQTPPSKGPASRLSTSAEEPSVLTEDTMVIHDEPNWEVVDLEATQACLQCAEDGADRPFESYKEFHTSDWGGSTHPRCGSVSSTDCWKS